ncbi:hypothetical protein QC762_0007180 [Podospora pseudocomata]|uniref:Uncharacterized protein n=3 Tax=Podospora TaxID=5144 RepID=A0ABR0HYD2_9PEZI|nr:hypothetical protein QC762_0007180 [Podospora pseudocomata]KAK4673096.1 hypothetical protein QC763_0010570 [Podospora pseudopauciseta]KAK4681599.1 hypothetical protein QC764_0010640 [Podospora pseudoanserina]
MAIPLQSDDVETLVSVGQIKLKCAPHLSANMQRDLFVGPLPPAVHRLLKVAAAACSHSLDAARLAGR